ncbi:autoinducer binding domain-containing protein [Mesorhizobium sp. L103C131B0]|uniref:autoinducer binding domain-containing protein n=2 Tax=Mesorhizobium TaxID=68287 RepID=UPI002473FFC7|nr:autoinducer binding domain-containing protein [Mesorhizobium sp. L103C131B0]
MFENFVEQLSASVDAADLCEAMASAAAGFDFPLFAYFTYPSASGDAPQLISNYPSSWTSRYLQQRYHSLDPVILRGLCAGCKAGIHSIGVWIALGTVCRIRSNKFYRVRLSLASAAA